MKYNYFAKLIKYMKNVYNIEKNYFRIIRGLKNDLEKLENQLTGIVRV